MIKRQSDLKVNVVENSNGGPGSIEMTKLTSKHELLDEVRLFSKITLKPGCGIGDHSHTGECEAIYVLKGVADYNDNGTAEKLYPGDVTVCPEGEIHGISNTGKEDVEIIALIVLKA